jgi:hypothetical protein
MMKMMMTQLVLPQTERTSPSDQLPLLLMLLLMKHFPYIPKKLNLSRTT